MARRTCREVADVLDLLVEQDCKISQSKGTSRWRITRPGYPAVVYMSSTPSDGRGLKNAKADLRRILGVTL